MPPTQVSEARGQCSEYDSSIEWLEFASDQYSICYTAQYAEDVPFVKEWMDRAVRLMNDKYKVSNLYYEQLRLYINVLLLPQPNSDADIGTTRFKCCWGYGDTAGGTFQRVGWFAHIPYLTPSHRDWKDHSLWGVMQLPANDFHAKNLVHEFTHAVQRSIWGEGSRPAPTWFSEGLAEYEGMFNTTEYNQTVGFNSLVRYVHDEIPDRLSCCQTLGSELPSFSTTDVYRGGALIMKYLADRFSEEMHVRLVRHRHPTFVEALAVEIEAQGTTVPEVFEDLQTWLAQRYEALESTLVPTPGALDRAALVALYNATDGPNWPSNSNWLSDAPIGEWHGVITDGGGRVTWLDLRQNELSGEIPPELGNLTNLRVLSLFNNQLSGEIPHELGSLTNLEWLQLFDNELSGEVPHELGSLTNLEGLSLNDNQLNGELPPELGSLANLTYMGLFGNRLSGELPSELGSLTNLEWLDLSNNRLSGELSSELGSLTNLERLYLGDNELSGELPPELGSLANLTHLFLHGNQLSGELPPELGSLANLTYMGLFGNQLSGELPRELGRLTNLEWLFLSGNRFAGCIPEGLRDAPANDLSSLGLPFCGD